MKLLATLWMCAVVLVVPACGKSPTDLVRSPGLATLNLIRGTGTISGSIAECSSWFLIADSGINYELTALDEAYRDPGLRVRFTLEERRDAVTVCMRGPVAEVVSLTPY